MAHYRACGIRVQRVMTDNGSAYQSKAFAAACRRLGVRHLRTRPYTPQTNGKAERFIQTCLREWAYATSYATSQQRREALQDWLHHYNCHRVGVIPRYSIPIYRGDGITWISFGEMYSTELLAP